MKVHARFFEPAKNIAGLAIRHLHRGVIERALAETFLEHARRVQQAIGNDGVEHPHAPFVKDAHQGLASHEIDCNGVGCLCELSRDGNLLDRHHVAGVVVHVTGVEPRLQVAMKTGGRKVVGPERGVVHACLGQRPIEIQHAH